MNQLIAAKQVGRVVEVDAADSLYVKRVLSLAVVGVVHAASLSIHAMWVGLARAGGLQSEAR